jgi:hypothetical protein
MISVRAKKVLIIQCLGRRYNGRKRWLRIFEERSAAALHIQRVFRGDLEIDITYRPV